jgi:hypothetical protein
MNEADIAHVQSRLSAAVGEQAWGTALGVGSFLTVEFGAEKPDKRGHGEYHLWVYCSAWRIETQTAIIASSEDPRDALQTAISHLDGRTLVGVQLEAPSTAATFEFSDGTVLRTFPIFSKDYEHWMFYLPDGSVFTAGPGTEGSWGS